MSLIFNNLMYSFPVFLIGCVTLGIGILIIINDSGKLLNRLFFAITFILFVWNTGVFLNMIIENQRYAVINTTVFQSALVFLFSVFFHFAILLTGYGERTINKVMLYAGYIFSTLFLGSNLFTNLFFKSMKRYKWGYYPDGGPLGLIYFIAFSFYFLYALYLINKRIKEIKGFEKKHLIFIMSGVIGGFIFGVTNFMPVYGFNIYPLGNIAAVFFPIFVGLAIYKYHFFNIYIYLRKSLVISTLFLLIIISGGSVLYFLYNYTDMPVYFYFIYIVFYSTVIFWLLSDFVNNIVMNLFFKSRVRLLLALNEFTASVLTKLDIDELKNHISRSLADILDAEYCYLCIKSDSREYLGGYPSVSGAHEIIETFEKDVIGALSVNGNSSMVYTSEKLAEKLAGGNRQKYEEKAARFDAIKLRLFSLLKIEGRLLGFVLVGGDKMGKFKDAEVLNDLQNVSNHIAASVQNALVTIEIKSIKLQLVQSEKLSALGQLIAGVAHELNNPLQIIYGLSQMSLESEDTVELQKNSRDIIKSVNRCKKIIESLLKFARYNQNRKREPANLNDLIANMLGLRRFEGNKAPINISTVLDKALPRVMIESFEIESVILNLVKNAEQAVNSLFKEAGGEIEIKTGYSEGYVWCSIKDNGPGISPDMIGKVFEPFFTTKRVGEGTGLGLSICYGIIRDHEGSIKVESTPGEGSLFTISLPVFYGADEKTGEATADKPAPASPASKSVLVIDDEISITDIFRSMLLKQGYEVDVENNAASAERRLVSKNYDAVILDLKVGDDDGFAILEKFPRLEDKFIVITGNIMEKDAKQRLAGRKVPLVFKPFDFREVIDMINLKTPGRANR